MSLIHAHRPLRRAWHTAGVLLARHDPLLSAILEQGRFQSPSRKIEGAPSEGSFEAARRILKGPKTPSKGQAAGAERRGISLATLTCQQAQEQQSPEALPNSESPPLQPSPGQARHALKGILTTQLADIKAAGLYKTEREILSPQGPRVTIADSVTPPRHIRQVLNFCANNYLGLSSHPAILHAARHALDSHGFGLSSVRFICGTQDLHTELERRLAQFHGTDDAVLFPSCFDANAGLFEALLTSDDAVISDELNHASIIDGIRLCKAQRQRYKHADMDDLERKLKGSQNARLRMIATDGVFSMQGDIAPLKDITWLANKYGALVFVDDCHATGIMGKGGTGTAEHCGLEPGQVDIVNSTLGKALGGGTGGYTAASREVAEMLRQRARPYLFSNSLAPSMAAAGIAALDLIQSSSDLRAKLAFNTKLFRSAVSTSGFRILPEDGEHPIVPIMLGDAQLAHTMASEMLQRGVYVVGFSYPVVPKDQARIRVQLSAAHTEEQINLTVEAFKDVGKELQVI